MKKRVQRPKPPRRILDIRFILTDSEADRALYERMKRDAQANLRTLQAQLRYLVNFAMAQMDVPRQPPFGEDDDNGGALSNV